MARNDRRYRNNRSYRNSRSRGGGDSKGKIVALIVLGVIVLILIGLSIFELNSKGGFYSIYYSIANGSKEADVNQEAISFTLTQDQMVEDYDYLYHLLAESAPAAYLGKDNFGYNFSDDAIYQLGLSEVKKCTSPEEFYAVMRAVTLKIPGSKEEALIPLGKEIKKSLDGADFGSSETSVKTDLFGNNAYIYKQLVTEGKKLDPALKLVYVGGEYAVLENDKFYGTVEEMDGKDPVEFVRDGLASTRILYDYSKKKAYVPELYLYTKEETSLSRKVKVKIKPDNSDAKEKDYYLDYTADMMSVCADEVLAGTEEKVESRINSTSHHVYTYGDYGQDLGYIRVTAFLDTDFDASHHDLNKTILEEALGHPNIILDLRDCEGKSKEYAEEIFFAELFATDTTVGDAYLVGSKDNIRIQDGNGLGTMIKEKLSGKKMTNLTGEDSKYIAVSEKTSTFVGNQRGGKKVYILTSNNTTLSAEGMAAAVRFSGQGTIYGSNTAGEGLSGYSIGACPNSKIVFTWCPYLEVSPENTVLNVSGVRADTYSSLTMDSYKMRLRFEKEGRDIYTYENRMQWDNVLKSAVTDMFDEE